MQEKVKKIPFGLSDFKELKISNYYYVDKTKYVSFIEDNPNKYIFFLRPRRFGKSLLISTLANYYDINKKDNFDEIFKDTYIGKNPTELRNSYYILRFDFSKIGTTGKLNDVEGRFNENIYETLLKFYREYSKITGGKEDFEKSFKIDNAATLVSKFFDRISMLDIKLYILIDEYDNFANNILVDKGEADYKKITESGGFVKDFFKAIKAGTSESVVDRFFITGVSQLVLSDITSGMNIGENISFRDNFNSMTGFNDEEVEELLEYYISFNKVKREDKEEIKKIFKAYYNNYCFSEKFNERVHNSNMVLFFLNEYMVVNRIPNNFIDASFSSDYGKLKYLIAKGKANNKNYNELLKIVTYGSTNNDLITSFKLERLQNTQEFISLLYYLGLLTIKGRSDIGNYEFEIPNDAVRSIDYEYIQAALEDVYELDEGFSFEMRELYAYMARDGKWEEPLKKILDIYYKYVPLRDGVAKEVGLKLFVFSFLIQDKFHFATSERELNRGYSDIYLETHMLFNDFTKYEYVIEFKYVAGGKEEVTKAKIEDATNEAIKQLATYEQDRKVIEAKKSGKIVKKLVIVGSSQKVELMEEV